jgi:hypothetical protein
MDKAQTQTEEVFGWAFKEANYRGSRLRRYFSHIKMLFARLLSG